MTAQADIQHSTTADRDVARMTAGGRMMARLGQRVVGAAFVLAAFGLWFAPGASWESDVMLFKLILSVCALLAGTGLIMASGTPHSPEVEFDSERQEVRLVRHAGTPQAMVLQRCAFHDLSLVERRGPHVRLWDNNRDFLAEVILDEHSALATVMDGLRKAGKVV